MNWRWDVVLEAWPIVLQGARITLYLSVLGVLFGTLFGGVVGLLRSQRPRGPVAKLFYGIATLYVELIRSTPFLVQVYLLYYGIPLFSGGQIQTEAFSTGVLAISINSAAYVSEIFRAGIQSIDKGQTEAGRSLGLTWGMTMRQIVLPQALRQALPALANELITLIKESSVLSVIGLQETTFKGRIVGSSNYAPFEPLLVVTLVYVVLTQVTAQVVKWLERRMGTHDHR